MNKFQIFGSRSSKDLDVMVFVDSIPKIDDAHNIIKSLNTEIKSFTKTDKEVNSNLAIIKDGVILKVFKGTEDECNNSLIDTYDLHTQYHENQITSRIIRDVELKKLRTLRVLLSFVTRTKHREDVKRALKSDALLKISVLKNINITNLFTDTDVIKKVNYDDFIKVYAFQLGQTLGLIDNVELYTKEDIANKYPNLKSFLDRDITSDIEILESYKNMLCKSIELNPLINVFEYNYYDKA